MSERFTGEVENKGNEVVSLVNWLQIHWNEFPFVSGRKGRESRDEFFGLFKQQAGDNLEIMYQAVRWFYLRQKEELSKVKGDGFPRKQGQLLRLTRLYRSLSAKIRYLADKKVVQEQLTYIKGYQVETKKGMSAAEVAKLARLWRERQGIEEYGQFLEVFEGLRRQEEKEIQEKIGLSKIEIKKLVSKFKGVFKVRGKRLVQAGLSFVITSELLFGGAGPHILKPVGAERGGEKEKIIRISKRGPRIGIERTEGQDQKTVREKTGPRKHYPHQSRPQYKKKDEPSPKEEISSEVRKIKEIPHPVKSGEIGTILQRPEVNGVLDLDESYVPPGLVSVKRFLPPNPNLRYGEGAKNIQLRKEVIPSLTQFVRKLNEVGYKVTIIYGYRSYQLQAKLYQETPTAAAPPGTSEHQTGFALDMWITKDGRISNLDPAVLELAEKFGFFHPLGWDRPHFVFIGSLGISPELLHQMSEEYGNNSQYYSKGMLFLGRRGNYMYFKINDGLRYLIEKEKREKGTLARKLRRKERGEKKTALISAKDRSRF